MRRREFIAFCGSAAAAWPLAAWAQQPAKPLIGFLNSASASAYAPMVATFQDGLNQTGFVEGRDVAIEYHWAEGDYDLLPWFATTLVNHKVVAIISGGGPRMRFAQIERELRANEDRWGAVFANPFMGISVLDKNHCFIMTNSAYRAHGRLHQRRAQKNSLLWTLPLPASARSTGLFLVSHIKVSGKILNWSSGSVGVRFRAQREPGRELRP